LRFPAKRAAIYALVSLGNFLFWHGLSSVVNVRMTVNHTLTPHVNPTLTTIPLGWATNSLLDKERLDPIN
jgi:hypothetical protein